VSLQEAQGPAAIWQIIHGLSSYWLVAAGVELGLFAALADRPRTVADLASSCLASVPQLAVALDGLAAIGLLSVTDGLYGLGPAAADFLVPGRPAYMGDLVLHSPGPADNWTDLSTTIRTGAPARPVDDDGCFYAQLVGATFPTQYEVARRVAARMDEPIDTVLDLGAGAAPWSVALLERFPDATAVVNDLPEVIPLAARSLTDHGVADRARLVAADYRTMPFEPSSFAVVVLGHVCRAEGAEGAAALIRQAAQAAKPGGTVIVSDYFVDDQRTDSRNARLLWVTMMANTRQGATFTYGHYRQWLTDAGFGSVELLAPFANQEVLLGTKGGHVG
jgi:ubiquinone/menaquinone biosynthesis C-methylase UbiE